jgi:hypothetical protein
MSAASIISVAALESPRSIEGKKWVFDAQFYVSETQTLIAFLQYFNKDDLEFEDVGFYVVYANVSWLSVSFVADDDTLRFLQVAKNAESAELHPGGLSPQDYHLVGDIVWVRVLDSDSTANCLTFLK